MLLPLYLRAARSPSRDLFSCRTDRYVSRRSFFSISIPLTACVMRRREGEGREAEGDGGARVGGRRDRGVKEGG
jgi:hypothetical protein